MSTVGYIHLASATLNAFKNRKRNRKRPKMNYDVLVIAITPLP